MEEAKDSGRLEVTITGGAHYMADWSEYANVDALMQALVPGEAVWLYAEPDNAYDRNAIECYVRCRRLGYVKAAEAQALQVVLREGMASGRVVRSDGHKTYWVEVEAPDGLLDLAEAPAARRLPDSLLPEWLKVPVRPEERVLDVLCAHLLAAVDGCRLTELTSLLEQYERLEGVTCCREEMLAWARLERRLGTLLEKEEVQRDASYARLRALFDKVAGRHHDRVGDGTPLVMYNDLLLRVREGADREGGLLFRYEHEAFAERPTKEQATEARTRFETWLTKASCGAFHRVLEGDEQAWAQWLYYAGYGRTDLLLLAAHVVVWQRLCRREGVEMPQKTAESDAATWTRNCQIKAFMHRLDAFMHPTYKCVADDMIDRFVDMAGHCNRKVRGREYPFFERVDEELVQEVGDFSYNAAAQFMGELLKLGLYRGYYKQMGDALGINTNIRNHISKGINPKDVFVYEFIVALYDKCCKDKKISEAANSSKGGNPGPSKGGNPGPSKGGNPGPSKGGEKGKRPRIKKTASEQVKIQTAERVRQHDSENIEESIAEMFAENEGAIDPSEFSYIF